ncbi:MAG TPA: hypothetical protein VMR21_05495 [Vicinamibacteria bacterium]|nr:hypothetical protein [Vicinamibacteria bacterium]
MSCGERGAALLLVLVALAVTLPLLAVLSDLVWMRQRQVGSFRFNTGGKAAVRGGLEVARARLASGRIALAPDQEEGFSLEEQGFRAVHVRVRREPDAVLTVDGRVLRAVDVAGGGDPSPDPDAIDDEARVIGEFRRLEVYLVEAECPARRPFGAVRLLAVLGRLQPEGLVSLGVRYDRGYAP